MENVEEENIYKKGGGELKARYCLAICYIIHITPLVLAVVVGGGVVVVVVCLFVFFWGWGGSVTLFSVLIYIRARVFV